MSLKDKFKNFFDTNEEYEYEEIEVDAYEYPEMTRKNKNVVNLKKFEQPVTQVILYEPKSYDEVQEIADNLLNHRSVVINLQQVDPMQAKRIVDFLSGTVYAVRGDIQKLGISTFLCTPENVEVSGSINVDSLDEHDY